MNKFIRSVLVIIATALVCWGFYTTRNALLSFVNNLAFLGLWLVIYLICRNASKRRSYKLVISIASSIILIGIRGVAEMVSLINIPQYVEMSLQTYFLYYIPNVYIFLGAMFLSFADISNHSN